MRLILIPFLLVACFSVSAQENGSASMTTYSVGMGAGLDYGGFGFRGTVKPSAKLGIFGAVGYNMNGAGFNGGAQWHFPQKRNSIYLCGMYGYNAVIVVDAPVNDKGTYYGPSVGAGFELHSSKKNTFWNFEILVPFRNSNFKTDMDTLKAMGASVSGFYPVTISIGYHLSFAGH